RASMFTVPPVGAPVTEIETGVPATADRGPVATRRSPPLPPEGMPDVERADRQWLVAAAWAAATVPSLTALGPPQTSMALIVPLCSVRKAPVLEPRLLGSSVRTTGVRRVPPRGPQASASA